MARITEKENFMMMLRGEQPEWVPTYSFGKMGPKDPATCWVTPSVLGTHRSPQGGFDRWGVEYVTTEETGFGALPKPGEFLIDDIRKWRDILKMPDLSDFDWEAAAKNDIEKAGINREETAVVILPCDGIFQQLMAFMGFTEGLCAMYEEPDEVMDLFEFISDFYLEVTKKCIEYYKPDIFNIGDDSATKRDPFISHDMFKEMLIPFYKKISQPAIDAGIPFEFHNCGRCEDYLQDLVDIGVCCWDPAQEVNDLKAVKAKFGNDLCICGGFDFQVPITWPEFDEEELRAKVRKTIDDLAPGGGYAFCGGVVGNFSDPAIMKANMIIADEVETYGGAFYK